MGIKKTTFDSHSYPRDSEHYTYRINPECKMNEMWRKIKQQLVAKFRGVM
jgi:hypothetical protein